MSTASRRSAAVAAAAAPHWLLPKSALLHAKSECSNRLGRLRFSHTAKCVCAVWSVNFKLHILASRDSLRNGEIENSEMRIHHFLKQFDTHLWYIWF
jgi:hypothetical protein